MLFATVEHRNMYWIEDGVFVSERASFTYIRSFREHDFQTHALVGNCERRASWSVNRLVNSARIGKIIRRHGQESFVKNTTRTYFPGKQSLICRHLHNFLLK